MNVENLDHALKLAKDRWDEYKRHVVVDEFKNDKPNGYHRRTLRVYQDPHNDHLYVRTGRFGKYKHYLHEMVDAEIFSKEHNVPIFYFKESKTS